MEVKLDIDQEVLLTFKKCPMCHKDFNQLKNKKTKNHAIPQFLKPKTNIIHSLCLECHTELNSNYNQQKINYEQTKLEPKTFGEFKDNFDRLRQGFQDKKLNRGQFGEGLWSNLVSYLEALHLEVVNG